MSSISEGAAGISRTDIEYGRAGDFSLRMDAHIPPGKGRFPAVVIVHGGGWIRGDRADSVAPLFRPLSDAGFAWFSISYRLAGESAMFSDAIKDVKQAVLHIREHAGDYHVDPDRLAILGESAGGQLASMAALSPELNGLVRCVVALYSPSDLVSLAKTARVIPPSLRAAVQSTVLGQMILGGLERVSPLYNVRADMPPFLLIHGTADSLVPFEQSTQMCERMKEAGASCELYPVPGGGHGIRWWESERLTAYKQQMVRWMAKQLAPRTAGHG